VEPKGNGAGCACLVAGRTVDLFHVQILLRDLKEAIGIALDLQAARLYATDLGGTVYSARLDGSDQKVVLSGQGSLTGIAVVHLSDAQGR